MLYVIVRERYLRKNPLSRCDTAKVLKKKGYGRFHGAKAVTRCEVAALALLRQMLPSSLLHDDEDPTIWEETLRRINERPT